MSNKLKNISLIKGYTMNQILDDFQNELSQVMVARNNLDIPSKGQQKGWYLKTYKKGFEIMKPITGLNWDARVSGREELKELLSIHSDFLKSEIKKIRNKSVPKQSIVKARNVKVRETKVKTNFKNTVLDQLLGNVRTKEKQTNMAVLIQKMIRKRLGKFFIPISDIPKAVVRLARDKQINLNEIFEITIQSSTNPDLILTKTFYSYDQMTRFINGSLEDGEQKKKYDMEIFRINGVMDFVKIINLHNLSGGCVEKGVKHRERLFSNHIYKFIVSSQESRDNNCGLEVLKKILYIPEKAEKIRRRYKIQTKTKMSFEQLNLIYNNEIKDDRRPLVLLTEQSSGVLNKADFNYIFIHREHYYFVEDMIPHDKNKKVKRGKLYVDLETRPTDECVYIKSKNESGQTVVKQSRILKDTMTAVYYKPYKGAEYIQSMFITTVGGKSSIRKFADWLIAQASDNKFYQIVAHNGSRFDYYFFLACLTQQETLLSQINFRGTSLIGMNFFNHDFRDSYCHLINSLDNLCKSYKVKNPKIKVIHYNGKDYTSEQFCFYKPQLSFEEYMNLQFTEPEYWRLQTVYCMRDVIGLSEVWDMYTFQVDTMIREMEPSLLLNCGVNTSLTVGGLAMKLMKGLNAGCSIFQNYKRFMDDDEEKYEFIKKFKRGGISHNNQCGRFEGVMSYDITSQYPAAMIYMSVPTGESSWTTSYDNSKYGYYKLTNLVFDNSKSFKPISEVLESGVLNWNTSGNIQSCYVDSFMIKYLQDNNGLISFNVEQGLVSNEFVKGERIFGRYVNTLFREKAKQDILKDELAVLRKKAKIANPLITEEDLQLITNGYNEAYRETIKLFLNAASGKLVENTDLYDDNVYVIKSAGVSKKFKSLNGNIIEKEAKTGKNLNQYMGLGVMVYSYSKRNLMEYINLLPDKADDVIHVETDSIYFDRRLGDEFKYNITQYKGDYPIKIGNELGNVKQEKDEEDVCHFLGKKFYQIGKTFKVKGIPMKTITEDGTFNNLIDKSIFERVYSGESIRVEYTTLQKNLYGRTYISSHKCHRTINSHPIRYKDYSV